VLLIRPGLSARALDRGLDVTAPARERLDVAVDLADAHDALEGRSVVVVVEDEIAGRRAISSPRPSRPIGCPATASATVSSPLAIMSATIGVSIVPGQTALTRTPRGAYSSAALLVRPSTPCLVAW
jgi:hypothetical protein